MAELADREELPRFVAPMLAAPLRDLPAGGGWALELKWDGCRAQLAVDRGAWRVRSRPGRCMTAAFGELAAVAEALRGRRVVLDGELVCLGPDGKPDFHALRPRITGNAGAPCTFVAFDVLHLDGRAVRTLPYARRRELLEELLPPAGPGWRVPSPLIGDPAAVLALVEREQLEGIVAKRLDAPYRAGRRSPAWGKRKVRRAETFAVTAWAPPRGDDPETYFVARRADDGTLRPAGAVQLGLEGERRRALRAAVEARLEPSRRRVRPVSAGVSVLVDFHGSAERPLRDPVLRGFAAV